MEAPGLRLHLPFHPEVDPWALGECGVDGLERLVTQRAQAFAVFATRLDDLGIHPRFGPAEKEAARVLDAAQIVPVERTTLRQEPTGSP